MKTMVYCKESGRLAKFELEGMFNHEQVMQMLAKQRIKVKGAVMLTYHEVKS